MRYNHLDLPKDDPFLFRRILHIAHAIQLSSFLTLVKARTMLNVERREAPMGLDPEFAEEEDGKWWSIVPGGVANNCAF